MADQSFIEKKVIELSKKLGIAQKDIIVGLMLLIEGKPLTDQIQILNDVNMEDLIKAKTSKVISGYTGANAGLLLGKIKFSPIQEKDLLALITQSEKYLTGEIVAMSNVLKQEVVFGILNGSTIDEILEAINSKGYGANVGMKRIINDGLNNYSRAVNRMMMETAPKNTKYIYIGPADAKTREFCLNAISIDSLTKNEIISMGWGSSLTNGGGINCRHSWEPISEDVRSQFYRKEEADKILNESVG